MERPWLVDKEKAFTPSEVPQRRVLGSGQTWSSNDRINMISLDPHLSHMENWSKRSSHASDTSSAYSGSDVMIMSTDDLDVDSAGLPDSEGEEGFSESLIVRDQVREYLEKDPSRRTEADIEVLLEFMQHMPAFSNMTLTVRRALCSIMTFAVIPKADTAIYGDGQEVDSWSVILNGHVEVSRPDGTIEHLHLGDSFGVTAVAEKVLHCGTMRTKVDDCQFVHVKQHDYHRILNQGNQSICHVEEHGEVVLVVEKRKREDGKEGQVILRGTSEKLILQLIENNAIDHNYIEDFLLTYRTFLKSPLDVTRKLYSWLQDPAAREKAARIVMLWVNSHFRDFESNPEMMEFLEKFEILLEEQKMHGQLRLLNMAYEARAHTRLVVLSRSTRDEILFFSIVGGVEKKSGVFVARVEKGSKAYEAGLMRGDQILEVNKHNFELIHHDRALEILRGNTQLAITVKSNLQSFRKVLHLTDNPPKTLKPASDLPAEPGSGKRHSRADQDSVTPTQVSALREALLKFNLSSKAEKSDELPDEDSSGRPVSRKSSSVSDDSLTNRPLSFSTPDLTSVYGSTCPSYDLPSQVVKIYRADQTFKYLLILKETTAREVVMLSLAEFGISDPSSDYSLNEVTFEECGLVKSRHLPDQMTNLCDRIRLNSRYYIRSTKSMEPLVPDSLVEGIVREVQTNLLELDPGELAIQLMQQDFKLFKDIEEMEYIDDLFDLELKHGCQHLIQFTQLVNREMFWVITEICSEQSVIRRAKMIKLFIKIARYCKVVKNFNSMFAILSGLGHQSVSRLRQSWDRVPAKYTKLFEEMQQLMDPSRNMSKYRNMLNAHIAHPPVIPFFPLVKKDLTFIHYGNDSRVDSLINFDKLRMIAKEVHQLSNLASGVLPSSLVICRSSTGEHTSLSTSALVTMKRKKSVSSAPNLKKIYDDMLMVRKTRTYLMSLKVIEDEGQLSQMSTFQEPPGKPVARKVESSTVDAVVVAVPTTESLTANPMFGTDSPTAVNKLLTLTDKVKPLDQKRSTLHKIKSVPSSPVRSSKKSHPQKPRPPPAVDLSTESSSVTGVNVKRGASKGQSQLPSGSISSSISSSSPASAAGLKMALDLDSGYSSVASSIADTQSVESISDSGGSSGFRRVLDPSQQQQQRTVRPWSTGAPISLENQCAVRNQDPRPNVLLSPPGRSVASHPVVPQGVVHHPRPLRPPAYEDAVRYSGLRQGFPYPGHHLLPGPGHPGRFQLLPSYPMASRLQKQRKVEEEEEEDAISKHPGFRLNRERSQSCDGVVDLTRTKGGKGKEDYSEDEQDLSDDDNGSENELVSVV